MILFGGVRQKDNKHWRVVVTETQVALKLGTSRKPQKFVRRSPRDSDEWWEVKREAFIQKIRDITQDW